MCAYVWQKLNQSAFSPLWLNSSVSSVSAEVITAEDSVGSWLSSLAMVVTLRRSAVLSHPAEDRQGRSLGNDTEPITWNTTTSVQEKFYKCFQFTYSINICILLLGLRSVKLTMGTQTIQYIYCKSGNTTNYVYRNQQSCLVLLATKASRDVQEHDFVGLQCSRNSRCHFRRVQHYWATLPVPPHWTNQWDCPAVQTPLEEAGVQDNGWWTTAGEGGDIDRV